MTEQQQPERRSIGKDFGEGKFLKFNEGEERTVVITNWGVENKEAEVKENDGTKVKKMLEFFCADVLNADGKEYLIGKKVLESSSIKFKIAIRPLILEAQENDEKTLILKVTRMGKANETNYFIKKVGTKKK